MKTRISFVLIVAVAALFMGCQNPASSSDSIVGTWKGTALGTADQTGYTATFSSNNTWSVTGTNGSGSGTWTKSGSTYVIVQTSPNASTSAGTVAGSTLTVTGGGRTSIYTKD